MDIYIKCSWKIWERIPRIEIDILDITPDEAEGFQNLIDKTVKETLDDIKRLAPDKKWFARTRTFVKQVAAAIKRRFARVTNG